MNTIFAALLLVVCTMALLILPMLPALIELRRKTDAMPLQVIPEYDVDVHSFASNFKQYLEKHYHGAFVHCADRPGPFYGADKEGKEYILISEEDVNIRGKEKRDQFTYRIFLGCGSLRFPGAMSYLSEVYARGSVYGGEEDIYRAILADENIILNPKSMLLRWCHAGKEVVAGSNCILHGRVSADNRIRLHTGCRFERLYAPVIEFMDADFATSIRNETAQATATVLPETISNTERRWLYQHDVEIPDGAVMDADLVVTGILRIGKGVRIHGSIKSHGDMYIGSGTTINGSTVTERNLYVADNCTIKGPVISEKDIFIDGQCQVGFMKYLTTICALHVYMNIGTVCHGTVWAREYGVVREPVNNNNETVS